MKTDKILPVWFFNCLFLCITKKKKLIYYLFWGVFFMWTIHLSINNPSMVCTMEIDECFPLFFFFFGWVLPTLFWPIRLCFRLLTYVNGWGFVNRKSMHIALKHNSGRNCASEMLHTWVFQTHLSPDWCFKVVCTSLLFCSFGLLII